MYKLRVFSARRMGVLRGLLGDITLYGVNGGATVETTVNLIRRVSVTPITCGEGYVLAFSKEEYDLLYEYLGEVLHQGDYDTREGDQLAMLATALGIPGWGMPLVNLEGVT